MRSCMLHGSETWPVRKENETVLVWTGTRMNRWMSGAEVTDRFTRNELRQRLGINDIIT